MNFISLIFVFSFPVVVLLYWKIPWKYRELFLLAVSYFIFTKRKFLGRRTASAYNGNHVSGGNCC